MHRNRVILVAFVVLAVAILPLSAKKQQPDYKSQAAGTFANIAPTNAHGLVVQLTNEAQVVTDPSSGFAGPFRSIKGNGTKKVTLTNPEAPINTGDAGIELVFRSFQKKVAIKVWWWTDEKGKRLGSKNKG